MTDQASIPNPKPMTAPVPLVVTDQHLIYGPLIPPHREECFSTLDCRCRKTAEAATEALIGAEAIVKRFQDA
jgi:hypothetical protein